MSTVTPSKEWPDVRDDLSVSTAVFGTSCITFRDIGHARLADTFIGATMSDKDRLWLAQLDTKLTTVITVFSH